MSFLTLANIFDTIFFIIMETIGERLTYYIESKGFSKKEFCEIADLPYSNFVRVLKNSRPLGINTLDKVINVLPELNINWLLYNKGQKEITLNVAQDKPDQKNIEEMLRELIRSEVNPKFERINKSIYILMKRDVNSSGENIGESSRLAEKKA